MIKYSKGFTLLELVIAISIVGILASLAMPAFDNQLKNSRLVAITNLVVGSYNLARSEAIDRGVQVQISNIADGWMVKEVISGNEIKRFEPGDTGITWTDVSIDVIYDPTGFRPFGSAIETVKICDSRDQGRLIAISIAGSTSVSDTPSCP